MISLDRSLVGDRSTPTDAPERHRAYAEHCEVLHIVVPTGPGFKPAQLSDNCFVYPTNARGPISKFFASIRILRNIHKSEQLDLVVAQHFAAPAAKQAAQAERLPLIVSMHSADFGAEIKWWMNIGRLLERMVKNAFLSAAAVRVVSPAVQTYLAQQGIAKERIHVIPTPVNTEVFQTAKEESVKRIADQWSGKKIVLYVGRLEPIKNIPLLLEAFKGALEAKIPTHLLIVGNGSQKQELKDLAEQLGIAKHVHFAGPKSSEELAAYYHASTVVALPSDSESLGKVLTEAGVAKRPVVSTKTVGASYIVDDGVTGLLSPVGNTGQFEKNLVKILTDEKFATHLGKAAPTKLKKKFDYETNIQAFVNLWKKTAKK